MSYYYDAKNGQYGSCGCSCTNAHEMHMNKKKAIAKLLKNGLLKPQQPLPNNWEELAATLPG